jgi:hypothetical protein
MSRVEAGFGFATGPGPRGKRSFTRFCGRGRGDPHRLESPGVFLARSGGLQKATGPPQRAARFACHFSPTMSCGQEPSAVVLNLPPLFQPLADRGR